MEAWDRQLFAALNRHVGQWPSLDLVAVELARNDLLKGGLAVAVIVGLWCTAPDDGTRERRRRVLATGVLATVLALALNRGLATLLEFRVRPLHDGDTEVRLAEGLSRRAFSDLSAFPSDHAVMFAGLATAAWCVSRAWGLLLFAHALCAVLLVRVYLGLHWPSDVVVGALGGAAIVLIAERSGGQRILGAPALALQRRAPAFFGGLAFLLLFELANLFQGAVRLGYRLLEVFGHDGRL